MAEGKRGPGRPPKSPEERAAAEQRKAEQRAKKEAERKRKAEERAAERAKKAREREEKVARQAEEREAEAQRAAEEARRADMQTPFADMPADGGDWRVPEFGLHKDPALISNKYAAADRLYEREKEAYEYRKKLSEEFRRATGRAIDIGPPPRHLIHGGPASPTMDLEFAREFCGIITMLPRQMLGVESTPHDKDLDKLAAALVRLSRHYPQLESKLMDWLGVGISAIYVASPIVGEIAAKRKGTWQKVRARYIREGYIDGTTGDGQTDRAQDGRDASALEAENAQLRQVVGLLKGELERLAPKLEEMETEIQHLRKGAS